MSSGGYRTSASRQQLEADGAGAVLWHWVEYIRGIICRRTHQEFAMIRHDNQTLSQPYHVTASLTTFGYIDSRADMPWCGRMLYEVS